MILILLICSTLTIIILYISYNIKQTEISTLTSNIKELSTIYKRNKHTIKKLTKKHMKHTNIITELISELQNTNNNYIIGENKIADLTQKIKDFKYIINEQRNDLIYLNKN
jgi:chromosome segregation ATPase